jgi:hypothetical protein
VIDLTKPEIKQAYLLGVEAGKFTVAAELDRVAQVTETRILNDLEHLRKQLRRKRMPSHSRIVELCMQVIKGEVVSDD